MTIETVGIVGLGVMGRGIAETLCLSGVSVVVVRARGGDPSDAVAAIRSAIDRRVAKGKLDSAARDEALARIAPASDLDALCECDLVIESAAEDLAVKAALLARIEEHVSRGTIVATNTSSLPLEKLAAALDRPDELVALHFFNPVAAMPLVEIAATDRTAPGVLAAARAFVEAIGKTPVEVTASPGYVVNRLLVPYLLHAIETLESGTASAEAIDRAMTLGAAHPMGPLALADFIGLDVVFAMARTLHSELGDTRYRAPSLLRRLVLAGHLGKKTKLGVYDWRGEAPVPNPAIQIFHRATHVTRMVASAADAE